MYFSRHEIQATTTFVIVDVISGLLWDLIHPRAMAGEFS